MRIHCPRFEILRVWRSPPQRAASVSPLAWEVSIRGSARHLEEEPLFLTLVLIRAPCGDRRESPWRLPTPVPRSHPCFPRATP